MNALDRSISIRSDRFYQWKSISSLYPWLIWFLASSFIFYNYLLQVSPGVMVSKLMHTFNLTSESMGGLAAFYFYAYLLMQFPVGILLDRFNPRYLISGAIIICASGALLFSQAVHLPNAQLGRILIGIGGAFSAVGAMKIISIWFPPKRFALISGLMMTMAMLGAIAGSAPLSYLVDHLGWRHAMRFAAAGGLLLAIVIFIFIRDKKTPSHAAEKTSFKTFGQGISKLLRNKQSWLISIYSGLAFAPISAFAGLWGIPFILQKYAMNRNIAAGLVSIAFIGFAFGSPFAGWLSDRINRRKPIMIIGTSMSLITISLIIYSPPIPYISLAILFFLFGCFSGFFFVSFAYIREVNHHQLSGSSIGFINMFGALFGALSEPLIGKLLDLGWGHKMHNGARIFSVHDYQHALIILPIALILALIIQIFIKETFCVTTRPSFR